MAIPMALMAVGTGMQIYSQWMANIEQSKDEFANAQFYREQADQAKFKMERDLDIASREYEYRRGATIGAEVAGGVDVGSGSAIINVAAVAAARIKELAAIKYQGEMEVKLARLRANRSAKAGETLGDTNYNLAQAGTTLLGNYTRSEGFGTKFSMFK